MAGTPTLADIYKMALAAEKQLVLDTETALNTMVDTLTTLAAGFPDEAKNTTAVQLVNRVLSAVTQYKTYDLPSAKNAYGITSPAATATTDGTTTNT